jgi:Flp pilus assembly protein TadD
MAPATAPRTAVSTAMIRHVQNARVIGEGDVELSTLRRRLARNPRDLDARILLARLYERQGVPELALEHYRLASAQFPDSVVTALGLAKMQRQMGEAEGALVTLRLCEAMHLEGVAELYALEGVIQDEQGRLSDGETAHRNALTAQPGIAALHNNLGYNLLLQKKMHEAAAEFRKAIEIDPHSDIAHNNLGVALASEDSSTCLTCRSEALAELGRGAQDKAVAHSNLAAVLMEQGHVEEARAEIDTALQIRHNLPAAMENLRLASEKDGQPATIHEPRRVNLKSRLASGWGRLTHASHARTPQVSSVAGTDLAGNLGGGK